MKTPYRISEDDYVDAMRLFNRFTPRTFALCLTAALALGILAMAGPPLVRAGAIGGLAGGLIVPVVGRYLVSPLLSRRHYRKYKAIQEAFTVELLDEGVRFASPHGESLLPWATMLKWRQDEHYVLIYLMPRMYHILPKSVASGGFDVPLLVERLTHHVGPPT